ncbi:hypothetical protein Mrad2831_6364 (plasmid) [Methylobacterium radiotolerans JCM 2831]|uniref:Uncharacterized protein n=1 Tax=Methylobacterium radiotolerans (strain ATCC 27329 / DSM 1819 / JCM 2831 / NBRC 15690 / NCIMB 10815 / 0-1) TaxID=426355 RepID=B1M9W1_METRJ|nr:hypothetical protein Mrad2831_6364 [Methylobacterium radiotolerans JCM 2831]
MARGGICYRTGSPRQRHYSAEVVLMSNQDGCADKPKKLCFCVLSYGNEAVFVAFRRRTVLHL